MCLSPGCLASTWWFCISSYPFPPHTTQLLARLEVPAAPRRGSLTSPALFTAVPDVQRLAGAPMTWEHKYLLFLPRTRSSDSQVTLSWLC